MDCRQQWQNQSQPQRRRQSLWQQYVWQRQKVADLAKKFKRHPDWVRIQLSKISVKPKSVLPRPAVFVADATFFRRLAGVCVFRLPQSKTNVYWREIVTETVAVYRQAREVLESQGWQFLAVVLDGRPGVRAVFADIPVQMCHFHQKAILRRYLTSRPKLPAGQDLYSLGQDLGKVTERVFQQYLDVWFARYESFLKERTVNPVTGRWNYTHRRLRAAYRSLRTNLPYLFTYQKHPELNIPKTTNSLDGYFSHLKDLIKVHRGIRTELRRQMITEILNKADP